MAKEEDKADYSVLIRAVIFGVLFAVVLVGGFLIGGVATCSNGHGTLAGLKCVNPQVVATCEAFGKQYIVPKELSTPSVALNSSLGAAN